MITNNTHTLTLFSLREIMEIGYCSFYTSIFEEWNVDTNIFKEIIADFSANDDNLSYLRTFLDNHSIEYDNFIKGIENQLKYTNEQKDQLIIAAFQQTIGIAKTLDPKIFFKILKEILENVQKKK